MGYYSKEHEDVLRFLGMLGYSVPEKPTLPELDEGLDHVRKLEEEVREVEEAVRDRDLPKLADALVDLAYFCHAAAAAFGLPWPEVWQEVQRTNMHKQPGSTERAVRDAIKPKGWEPPRIEEVLRRHGWPGGSK